MKSFCKLFYLITLTLFFYSCSTSSAASEELQPENTIATYEYLPKDAINHATTIDGLISSFPKFKNEDINNEVKNLKISLTDYLKATRTYNQKLKMDAILSFEKSYKKIQKLRKFMAEDDDEILNRYLVKIKTTVNLLEASQKAAFLN